MKPFGKKILAASLSMGLVVSTAYADTVQNAFISYFTADNVKSLVNYAQKNQLGGYIMWEISGDMPYGDSHSLLKPIANAYVGSNASAPMVMGYWADWDVYTTDRAQAATPYGISGSIDGNGNPVNNTDLNDKLTGLNVLTYAFVEAQATTYQGKPNPNPSQIGTLYVNDPWADLAANDSFCGSENPVCWFVDNMKGIPASPKMGNFEAFAKLSRPANNLGALQKVISVGGYGHDDSFEAMLGNSSYENNFIQSAKSILDAYHLDGIDLDYENPNMTLGQSKQFANFVSELRKALPDKLITVTILSDPDYLQGKREGQYGFAAGTLQAIAGVANKISLMTYDFHGAFDYNPGVGTTGFLSNIIHPSGAPQGYRFSTQEAVEALQKQGVPAAQIAVGIPAYGRALAGIPAGSDQTGLYQVIPATATTIPGDLDTAGCTTQLPLNNSSCNGMFSYKFIVNNLLQNGFAEKVWQDQGYANGATAYALQWNNPTQSYNLEVSNTGSTTSGDLGIQVSIHDANQHSFGPSDWLNPGVDKTYSGTTNPSTQAISNQSNLTVHWSTYSGGPAGDCPSTFDFTKNYHVMVKVDKYGNGVCAINPL